MAGVTPVAVRAQLARYLAALGVSDAEAMGRTMEAALATVRPRAANDDPLHEAIAALQGLIDGACDRLVTAAGAGATRAQARAALAAARLLAVQPDLLLPDRPVGAAALARFRLWLVPATPSPLPRPMRPQALIVLKAGAPPRHGPVRRLTMAVGAIVIAAFGIR